MTNRTQDHDAARDARHHRAMLARRADRAALAGLRTLAGLPVRVATIRALELRS